MDDANADSTNQQGLFTIRTEIKSAKGWIPYKHLVGDFNPIYGKIKNVPHHQPGIKWIVDLKWLLASCVFEATECPVGRGSCWQRVSSATGVPARHLVPPATDAPHAHLSKWQWTQICMCIHARTHAHAHTLTQTSSCPCMCTCTMYVHVTS